VLYAYERFGLLGRASAAGPVSSYTPPPRPNINDIKAADAATTERLSEASAVLLKNDGAALPLKGSNLKSVAVIGPTGRQVMVNTGLGERARGVSRTGMPSTRWKCCRRWRRPARTSRTSRGLNSERPGGPCEGGRGKSGDRPLGFWVSRYFKLEVGG
jgi:hypothetical protein